MPPAAAPKRPAHPARTRAIILSAHLVLVALLAVGCRSLFRDDPETTTVPPRTAKSAAITPTTTTGEETWSALANAAQDAMQRGELEASEELYLSCMAATESFADLDVRRRASLAIPSRLAERYQAAGDWEGAARITNAVLAEAQGGMAFPLEAWAEALLTRLEIERIQEGPEAELETAQQIAEIHFGPADEATIGEITLRQAVGRLLAAHEDDAAAAAQLGWAARAAEHVLRIDIADRLALLFEAAALSQRAGDLTTADFLLREAVELAQRSAPGTLVEGSALNQRGWFLVEQGRPHAALVPLEQAADIARSTDEDAVLRAAIFDSLAVALHRDGRLEDASKALDEAMRARDEATPEQRAALSMLDAHRASLDHDLGAADANAADADAGS